MNLADRAGFLKFIFSPPDKQMNQPWSDGVRQAIPDFAK